VPTRDAVTGSIGEVGIECCTSREGIFEKRLRLPSTPHIEQVFAHIVSLIVSSLSQTVEGEHGMDGKPTRRTGTGDLQRRRILRFVQEFGQREGYAPSQIR
jgi:hypothetical protein